MPVNQESNLAMIAAVNLQRSGTLVVEGVGLAVVGSCTHSEPQTAPAGGKKSKIKQITSTPSSWGLGKVFLMVRKCTIMTLFLHRGRFFPPGFPSLLSHSFFH